MLNPVAQRVTPSIALGNPQSGNYLRGWLHLGFNEAEDHSAVHEGIWPVIGERRIAPNFRWAPPDGGQMLKDVSFNPRQTFWPKRRSALKLGMNGTFMGGAVGNRRGA